MSFNINPTHMSSQSSYGPAAWATELDLDTLCQSLEIPYEQPTSYDLAPFGFPSAFDASTGTESLGSPESGNNSSGDADNSQAAPSSKDLKRKKRREQNRAAQRAYRERKEQSLKTLEEQLSELQKRYDGLAESHADKEKIINRLNQMITSLILEIQTLRNVKDAKH